MDAHQFDQLVRSFLTASTRRGLLWRLALFLVAGVVASLAGAMPWTAQAESRIRRASERGSSHRRMRRKKRHKHGRRRRGRRRKKTPNRPDEPSVCNSASCPDGCCQDEQCLVDDNAACGTGGGACTACTGFDTCGGGGVPGQCGCTVQCPPGACGEVDGGCGNTIECDICGGTTPVCIDNVCTACSAENAGTSCTPINGGTDEATCHADGKCCVDEGGFSGRPEGGGCLADNCCSGECVPGPAICA